MEAQIDQIDGWLRCILSLAPFARVLAQRARQPTQAWRSDGSVIVAPAARGQSRSSIVGRRSWAAVLPLLICMTLHDYVPYLITCPTSSNLLRTYCGATSVLSLLLFSELNPPSDQRFLLLRAHIPYLFLLALGTDRPPGTNRPTLDHGTAAESELKWVSPSYKCARHQLPATRPSFS